MINNAINNKTNKYLPAAVVLSLGLILSYVLFDFSKGVERKDQFEVFRYASTARINVIANRIENELLYMKSIVSFYQSSNFVSRKEFKSFLSTILSDDLAVQAMNWIPVVAYKDKNKFERDARASGYKNFIIKQKNKNGKNVAVAKRETYYPIYYVQPLEGNEQSLGLDLGLSSVTLEALVKARDTGVTVTSGVMKLDELQYESDGIIIFSPIYKRNLPGGTVNERRKNIQGFVSSVIRISKLVSSSLNQAKSKSIKHAFGIDIYIFDEAANKNDQLIYLHNSRSRKSSKAERLTLSQALKGEHVATTFDVGDRKWTIVTRSAGLKSKEISLSTTSNTILMLSLVFTFALMLYVFNLQKRREVIEQEVMQRTDELNKSVAIAFDKEQHIKMIMDNTADAIVTFNEMGIIETINRQFENIFQVLKEDAEGENINDFLSTEGDDFLKEIINTHHFDLNITRSDSSTMPVDVTLSSIIISDVKIFIAIIRDLTKQKEHDKMKEGFISTVSHELRTPMTAVKGSLSLLLSGAIVTLPEKAKTMLEVAFNNSERLIRLINDILDVDKMVSGKMTYNMQTVNLSSLIAESVVSNHSYAEKYGVSFVMNNNIKEANVTADADRLHQVMSNLLSNAAKFSKEGDEIKITLELSDDQYRVTVIDKGDGIPDDFREKIFDRFSQADSDDNKQIYGTGLGLAISKVIIDDHSGSIDYESEQGKGTHFYFSLSAV